jgi:hypothetical protein
LRKLALLGHRCPPIKTEVILYQKHGYASFPDNSCRDFGGDAASDRRERETEMTTAAKTRARER